ncbi:MAG TPA: response regulator [Bacteroidota bacterium]|nr:response regulator [Bacteroidota bacterium]
MKNSLPVIVITARSQRDWKRINDLVEGVHDSAVVEQTNVTPEQVDMVRALRPEIMILDIDLPPRAGIHFLEKVRGIFPSLKIIVLSNNPSVHYRNVCRNAGALFFFDKATEFDLVAGAVHQLLNATSKSTNNQITYTQKEKP